MPSDLLPVHSSPRVSQIRLREEVEALAIKIKEEEDQLNMLKKYYHELTADRDNPKFADAVLQTLIGINQTSSTIQESKKLLSDTEANLEQLERGAILEQVKREAELRNAILTEYEHVGLAQEGPDSAYVPDMSKFTLMENWLEEEKVLLLCSPPGSGKTTFAVRFTVYLNNSGSVAYFMNASRTLQLLNDGASMKDVWKNQFGLSFDDICGSSRDRRVYIVVDEAQAWYPGNGLRHEVEVDMKSFWSALKIVQEQRDWSTYIAELASGASESVAAAKAVHQVRLLFLAGYGERCLGSFAMPFEFVDPQDPSTNKRLPLGLNFLQLDRVKTHELITKYIDIQNKEGKQISFGNDNRVHDLIFLDTNGHVGAIRTFLFHAVRFDIKTTEDIFQFVSHTMYQTDLRGSRAFLPVAADIIAELPPSDLAMLIRYIILYKQGYREFPEVAMTAVRLVKRGILINATATTGAGNTTLSFPSPAHFDLTLYNMLHRRVTLEQNISSFESALKEMVLRMNPKLLKDTTPSVSHPYERQWQDECVKCFRIMSGKTVETEVGREFNQRAYLDMYVNELQWGIELIRRGVGKRLEEHVGRFREIDGRYRNIPLIQYAVLNFTDEVPNEATLDMYEQVWHLVYNATYTKITVYRMGHFSDVWDLIGFHGRTEY